MYTDATRIIENVTNEFPEAKDKNLEVMYDADSSEYQVSDQEYCYAFYDDHHGNGVRQVKQFIREY